MGAPVVGRSELKSTRDFARAASISFTLRISGTVVLMAGIGVLHAAIEMLRHGARAARRMPEWVQALLVVAVLLLLVNPRSRAWITDRIRMMGTRAWAAGREIMPIVVSAMERSRIATVAAKQEWANVDAGLPQRSTLALQPLRVHVLTACVRSATPLTTEEIAQAVARQGYRGGVVPSPSYLRRVLRTHSALMRAADWRWTPQVTGCRKCLCCNALRSHLHC